MRITLPLALALFSLCAAAQVQPGNWELSLTTQLAGQPQPTAVTETRCLTDADARDPSNVLGGSAKGTCAFSNKHDSGSVFTFEVSCTGALPMAGKGSVSYTATTINADLDLAADGGKFGMRASVIGRRLGGC